MFLIKKEIDKKDSSVKVALLIRTAKIDEKYTIDEENIIKKTLLELGTNQNEVDEIIIKAKQSEEKSNQILNFTKEIKNQNEKDKIKIIESLWRIIYSNKDADIYETNLMRTLWIDLYWQQNYRNIKEKIKRKLWLILNDNVLNVNDGCVGFGWLFTKEKYAVIKPDECIDWRLWTWMSSWCHNSWHWTW